MRKRLLALTYTTGAWLRCHVRTILILILNGGSECVFLIRRTHTHLTHWKKVYRLGISSHSHGVARQSSHCHIVHSSWLVVSALLAACISSSQCGHCLFTGVLWIHDGIGLGALRAFVRWRNMSSWVAINCAWSAMYASHIACSNVHAPSTQRIMCACNIGSVEVRDFISSRCAWYMCVAFQKNSLLVRSWSWVGVEIFWCVCWKSFADLENL
jgi:hypothetical protein